MDVNLISLPSEVLNQILEYTSSNDKVACSQISKKMQSVAFSNLLSHIKLVPRLGEERQQYMGHLKAYCSYFQDRVDQVAQLIMTHPNLRQNVFEAKRAIDNSLSSILIHSCTLPQFMFIDLWKSQFSKDVALNYLYSTYRSDFSKYLMCAPERHDFFQENRFLLEAANQAGEVENIKWHAQRILTENKKLTKDWVDLLK